MALSFKEGVITFGHTIYNLPSTIATGTANLIFGNKDILNARDEKGALRLDKETKKPIIRSYDFLSLTDRARYNGLVGMVLGAGQYALSFGSWLSHQVSSFVSNHETAIKRGFWISLAVAGVAAASAAVLAFALPAAFAAVTGFSVLGLSIASIAGSSLVAQVFVSAGLAAGLSVAGTAAVASIANTVEYIGSLFTVRDASQASSEDQPKAVDVIFECSNDILQKQLAGSPQAHERTPAAVIAPYEGTSVDLTKQTPALEPVIGNDPGLPLASARCNP